MSALPLIANDRSEFNARLGLSLDRRLAVFRCTFGASKIDNKFLENANDAAADFKAGRIDGVVLYAVYTNESIASQFALFWKAIGPSIPPWLVAVMHDVETWRGQSYALHGDHSTSINTLIGMHAAKFKTFNSQLAYANWGDKQELVPRLDSRVRYVEAKYSSEIPSRPRKVAQQYDDGSSTYGVPRIGGVSLPRTAPGGERVDSIVFPAFATAKAFVASCRPSVAAKPAPKPPAPKPAPLPLYPVSLPDGLRDTSRHYWLGVTDQGHVQLHKDHKLIRTL
ncbi:hypothetical protein [Jatrophihabitans sp.]|uniref:hypothetical protein n=1 Tax=Jatrophihabitans sp. TaxID=1932789 RepID=UPI0030C77917|nr:hypothetical protein [Jatrophihabitans sp.]